MRAFWNQLSTEEPRWSWAAARDYALILLGAVLQALSLRLFLVPAQLASGGVSGLSQIINSFTGWPIGLMVLLGNLPLFFLGWRFLGGMAPSMADWTALALILIAIGFMTIAEKKRAKELKLNTSPEEHPVDSLPTPEGETA